MISQIDRLLYRSVHGLKEMISVANSDSPRNKYSTTNNSLFLADDWLDSSGILDGEICRTEPNLG